jgi:DNA-binding response OmpR family regulator
MSRVKEKVILVVDDEPSIRQVCSQVLAREGYQVDIATNSKIAQEILDMRKYDLCLIDIRTPAMNGFELYYWLKDNHPEQARCVIFTSGDVYSKETEDNLQRSGRDFLPKPFTTEELKAIVKEFFKEEE